jgi:hypothetical protein
MTPMGGNGMRAGNCLEYWEGKVIARRVFFLPLARVHRKSASPHGHLRNAVPPPLNSLPKDGTQVLASISAAMKAREPLGNGFLEAAYYDDLEGQFSQQFGNHDLRTSAESAVQNGVRPRKEPGRDGVGLKCPIRFVVGLHVRRKR